MSNNYIPTLLKAIDYDIRHTPMLLYLVPTMTGVWLGSQTPLCPFYVPMASAVLTLLILLYSINRGVYRRDYVVYTAIALTFTFFGISYGQLRHKPHVDVYGPCRFDGIVNSTFRMTDNEVTYVVDVDSMVLADAVVRNVTGCVTLSPVPDTPLVAGHIINVIGHSRHRSYSSIYSFDYRAYLEANGIQFVVEADSANIVGHDDWSVSSLVGRARHWTYERFLSSGVSERNSNFLVALMVGDRSRLDKDVKTIFGNCGIIHVLAVSGLHVGAVYGVLLFVLNPAVRRFKQMPMVLVALMWMYALLCGMSASVVRATTMLSVYELGKLYKQQTSAVSSMSVAAFVIVVIDPMCVYSVGFWLSFSSVWGIVTFYAYLQRYNPFGGNRIFTYVYKMAVVSVVAQLATLPFSLLCFHRFPLYFLLNNLVVVFLIPFVMGAAVLTLLTGVYFPFGWCVDEIVSFINGYATYAGALPYSVINDVPFSMCELVLVLLLFYVLGWLCSDKWIGVDCRRRMPLVAMYVFMSLVAVRTGLDVYSSWRSSAIIYDYYGRVNVSVLSGGHFSHLLSDTSRVSLNVAMSSLNVDFRADGDVDVLRDGTLVCLPSDTVCFVGDKYDLADVHSSWSIVVSGDVMPQNDVVCRRVILSSRLLLAPDWVDYCQVHGIECRFLADGDVWIE